MWKTAGNDRSHAAKLRVLTLCTGEGARFGVLQKIALTKISTAFFWRFKFFFLQCIASRPVKLYYQRPAIHLNCFENAL
jgi:hypothetical protein